MSGVTRFRELLAYETEANRRVLGSLRSVPEARRGDPAFAKARGILAHNQMARRLWLSRLGATPRPQWVMFPDWSVERIEADAADLDGRWGAYLAGLTETDLDHDVSYSSTEGVGYRSTAGEILTHVVNHSTYHRGQIAMLVTQCGGERASTDYIGLTRRTV